MLGPKRPWTSLATAGELGIGHRRRQLHLWHDDWQFIRLLGGASKHPHRITKRHVRYRRCRRQAFLRGETGQHRRVLGSGCPRRIRAPNGKFATVSAGNGHTCGVRQDGSVDCWGEDFGGQATPPTGGFTSVSVESNHTCGVKRDGSVSCWGIDEQATEEPDGKFTSVSAGPSYNCGTRQDGTVACWGSAGTVTATAPDACARPVPRCRLQRHACQARWFRHMVSGVRLDSRP